MAATQHYVYDDPRQIPFRYVYYLGHGGQGTVDTVERASEPPGGKLYARKHFVLSKTPKPRELATVLQEIKIASTLNHDHIVRLVETYQCKNTYAMIMDPVAESNLGIYISDLDDVPEDQDGGRREQLSRWFGCLANALAFLHAKKIHHRDIKPQNILTLKGNVLLTDFGISKEFQEHTNSVTTDTIGTRTYRSPELETSRRPGRREDIFSLGAVYLEMLTVYSGQGQLETFRDFRGGPYCLNIEKVREWMDFLSETKKFHKFSWYPVMLYLCHIMLGMERESRPYADDLTRCWEYQPFLAIPPTLCNCIAPSAERERRRLDTLGEALRRSSERGDWLPELLLTLKSEEVNAEIAARSLSNLRLASEDGDENASRSPHSKGLHEDTHLAESDSVAAETLAPDAVQAKIQAILAEMTRERFEETASEVLKLAAQSKNETDGRTLRQITQAIFMNVCDQVPKSGMYARLCSKMSTSLPHDIRDHSILDKDGSPVGGDRLFRKYLLNRCQEEYDLGKYRDLRRSREFGMVLTEDLHSPRWLGLLTFMGQLYNFNMLTVRIIDECIIQQLGVEPYDKIAIQSFATLVRTVGAKMMKGDIAIQNKLAGYFDRIERILNGGQCSAESRYILENLINRRNTAWVY